MSELTSAAPRVQAPDPKSLAPSLYACVYQPPSAASAAQILTDLAEAFSPRYQRHGDQMVTIDMRGLDRLLGSPHDIGEALRRDAAERGLRAHIAVARTQTAAMVLALASPGLRIVDAVGQAAALAPIPVGVLEKVSGLEPAAAWSPEPILQVLRQWGIRTLGEFFALPSAELSARLGRHGLAWQAIARGEDTHPLVPSRADERFDATLALEWPIEGLEPLSFVLTRLIEPLSTRLEARDRGAAALHIELRLVTRDLHTRRLDLPSPLRDVRTLRTLALLDLESHPPGAAIDQVTITIDPTPGRVLQHTLFTRPYPTPEQLSTLLARLGALMGQDRIGAPATVDSYRPGAFEVKPFALTPGPKPLSPGPKPLIPDPEPRPSSLESPVTALRRYRQPVPARVAVNADQRPVRVTTDRRGFAGGGVTACVGPWRTSGEWWVGRAGRAGEAGGAGACLAVAREANEGGWDRDEWDVALNDGAAYRIFRDRASDAWFIEAIVD